MSAVTAHDSTISHTTKEERERPVTTVKTRQTEFQRKGLKPPQAEPAAEKFEVISELGANTMLSCPPPATPSNPSQDIAPQATSDGDANPESAVPIQSEPVVPLSDGVTHSAPISNALQLPINAPTCVSKSTDTLTPEMIASYARDAKVEIFRDQHGNVFARIPVGTGEYEHFECLPIKSQQFMARLVEIIARRTESTTQLSTVRQAIDILRLEAFRSSKKKLHNRRTTDGDEIFIDLGDDSWRTVRINSTGSYVEKPALSRFFRPQHMLPLPEPVSGGNLDELFTFVPEEDPQQRLLVKSWLLAALYDRIPNPILLFVGQQGSAKTTRSRRMRSLIDPSVTPVLGDLERQNLFLTFQHHAVPCFENVSSFSRMEADTFCRAVTGNGTERRKLYTDGDQVLYSFRRPIIINGIDIPSTRPDFLDRCLTINCRRIEQFLTLEELDRQFEAARPRLFGSILDLLAKTLRILPSAPPSTEFRMADFARFGRAVALALGLSPESFDDAYRLNIQHQGSEILDDAPMVRALTELALRNSNGKKWEGTAEQLLKELRQIVHVSGDEDAKKDLPKSPRWLSSRVEELAPALVSRRIVATKLPRTNASRLWQVYSTADADPNYLPEDLFVRLGPPAEIDPASQNPIG